jgi:CRP/FNR family cyclic AMP-dependent transcriptional regulator
MSLSVSIFRIRSYPNGCVLKHGAMPESRLKLLQEMPVFGGISEDTLKFLLELAPIVFFPKGQFFFREGDQAVSMFVLEEEGRVNIIKTRNGHDYSLGFLEKDDCFGEMALIDLFPRSGSVMAVEDCQAIEISSATLYELYEKDLEQFTMIQMNIAREISHRLCKADERLFEDTKARSITEKMPYST